MGQIYLKFKYNTATNSDDKPKTWLRETFEKSVIKILMTIILRANPDSEEKIGHVDEWLIEIKVTDVSNYHRQR